MNIKIGNKSVGKAEPCIVISEIGINHNGKIEIAKKLIDEAKKIGADIVKFQTYRTELFLSKNILVPAHVKSTESFLDMLRNLELTEEEHYELSNYCTEREIIFISTPLDKKSVDLLVDIGVPAFKVASCDLDNLPLLKYIAGKQKPIILSTGMGTIAEVGEAIETISSINDEGIILLHCIAAYPPEADEINLRAIQTLKTTFQLPVGFSDHTIGINVPLIAVALGAKVIEKHFTLDKKMEGPDHAVSSDPEELKRLISGIREVEKILGSGIKMPSKSEIGMIKSFRRSIVANREINIGETITEDKLAIKRPGTGIPPKYIDFVIGKLAKRNIKYDDLIKMEDF